MVNRAQEARVHLVAGAIGSGKSTLLRNICSMLGQGDGVVNQRLICGGAWIGQHIVHLSTGQSRLFTCRDGFTPCGWDELWRLSNLTFSRSGMAFAHQVLGEITANSTSPVFLDEVGPLELQGFGFHQQFLQLLHLGVTIYVAVRDTCLSQVITRYSLQNYTILRVEEHANWAGQSEQCGRLVNHVPTSGLDPSCKLLSEVFARGI